jgi:TolA-binding protein
MSVPNEADISVVDSNGIATSLGKTPLTSNEGDVYKGSNRYTQVKIKKEGFLDQEVVLMKSTFGSDTVVNVQLKKDETVQNIGEQSITQEKVASSIARANGLIQSKQYIEAEAVMANFIEQFPSVSVGYDYLGNINYLQKKYAKALKYYNRALSLNPQNSERRIIVERIQSLVKSQTGEVQ